MSDKNNWYVISGSSRQATIDLDEVIYVEAGKIGGAFQLKMKLKAANGRGDTIMFKCGGLQEMKELYSDLSTKILSS